MGGGDGAEGIFGLYRARVGCGLASGPTLKRPCAVILRLWDGEQINNKNNPELFREITKNLKELRHNDKIKEILDTTKIIKQPKNL